MNVGVHVLRPSKRLMRIPFSKLFISFCHFIYLFVYVFRLPPPARHCTKPHDPRIENALFPSIRLLFNVCALEAIRLDLLHTKTLQNGFGHCRLYHH